MLVIKLKIQMMTTIRNNIISGITSDNTTGAILYDGINLGLGANTVTQNVEIFITIGEMMLFIDK